MTLFHENKLQCLTNMKVKLYDMIVLLERVTTLNNHENAHHSDQIKMNLKSRLNRIEGQVKSD